MHNLYEVSPFARRSISLSISCCMRSSAFHNSKKISMYGPLIKLFCSVRVHFVFHLTRRVTSILSLLQMKFTSFLAPLMLSQFSSPPIMLLLVVLFSIVGYSEVLSTRELGWPVGIEYVSVDRKMYLSVDGSLAVLGLTDNVKRKGWKKIESFLEEQGEQILFNIFTCIR